MMVAAFTLHADALGLLVAFGAGMLSFLSPCVLPLVPAYVSMVSGLSAAELNALHTAPVPAPVGVLSYAPIPVGVASGGAGGPHVSEWSEAPLPASPTALSRPEGADLRRQRARVLRGILSFMAGFTVIFVILGASASAIGRLFLTHQRTLDTVSGILMVVFGAVLVAMASGVTMPMALSGERRFVVRPSQLGNWAPPVLGMAFAFAWTPCIGPVLGSVLSLAAGTGGSATGGIVLLLAYSLGLGVPFLLSGLAFGRMTAVLARVQSRLRAIDLVGGAVLVGFGLLLVTGHVSLVSDFFSTLLHNLHLDRLATSTIA
jgi:cytochrome c-type biogenesis protein